VSETELLPVEQPADVNSENINLQSQQLTTISNKKGTHLFKIVILSSYTYILTVSFITNSYFLPQVQHHGKISSLLKLSSRNGKHMKAILKVLPLLIRKSGK